MEPICCIYDSAGEVLFICDVIFIIQGTSFPLYNHPNLLVGECDFHS